MTVKQLIKKLEKCNPDALVVLSEDAEGNTYNPLYEIEGNMVYDQEYKEVGYKILTKDMEESGYTEEDLKTIGEECVTLWPED